MLSLCGWCGVASAALSYTYSGSPVAITDADASGVAFTFSLSDPVTAIGSISVTLDISGGHNGDLYAYLSHDAGGYAVLLNRAGVGQSTSGSSALGYADPGFLITLSSSGAADVHFYQNNSPTYDGNGRLTGTWRPDGRDIDPESAASEFDAAGTVDFGSFTGVNPNGSWTIFFADVSPGAVSTINGFTLDITAVPEPVNVALPVFAAVAAGFGWWRRRRTGPRRN